MVAQRGRGGDDRGVTAREGDAAPAKKAESKSAAGSSERKRKLGFKEKHALETLPKTIAGLQKQIAEYQAALADAQLFSRNPAKFQAATAGLEKAGADLAVAEIGRAHV